MNTINHDFLEMLHDAADTLAHASSIVITGHRNPDGDAVGSCLAIARLLQNQGKLATVVLPKKDVGSPKILDGFGEVVDIQDFDFSSEFDLLVVMDCGSRKRICSERFLECHPRLGILNIDHHGAELFGNCNLVVVDFSSTGELVFHLARTAGWKLDPQSAEALWTAIASDTDHFTLPATTAQTLHCAGTLHECGIRAAWLNDQLFRQVKPGAIQLQAKALSSLELWLNGTVATIALAPEDYRQTECTKQDSDAFPLIPLSVAGCKLGIFFYPRPVDNPMVTRISIRSRENSPVTALMLANAFGGSGHTHSAAAAIHAPLTEAKQQVKAYLEQR